MKSIILSSLLLVACGGGQKTGSGVGPGNSPPPPPDIANNAKSTEPKVVATKEEKTDYAGAYNLFAQNDKGTWSESACRQAAERFADVVRSHPKVVTAQYMVGLAYHRCNLFKEAEAAYQAALRINPAHGDSLSNLGQIYYQNGKISDARNYWEQAVKANGKLIAARIGLASVMLDQMRKQPGCQCDKDPAWKKLDEDARFHLSNVLGVDSDNVKAYTLFGLIYFEGYQKNKNRLDLAKTLLDEGKKRNEKYADLQNAYGLYYMHRNSLNEALQHFMAAVTENPRLVEARMNVGWTTVGFRKYDTAKEQFSKVLELDPKRYEAYIGLGIALRGLKDLDGAEEQYGKARGLDGKRGEAFYNLGVLWKDFRANKQADLKASQEAYRKAKGFFQQYMSSGNTAPADLAEAKEQVTLCDKNIAQIDQFIAAQAAAPPPPPAPPAGGAPPPAGGAAPPAGGTPPAKKP